MVWTECYSATGLKLEGAIFERGFLRSAAAAFSASCFANRKAALLFVRGVIDGLEQTLLGRGATLAVGASDVLSVVFGLDTLVGLETREGRAATDDGRGAAWRGTGVRIEACEAGRLGICEASEGSAELWELLRDMPGSFGVVAPRTGIALQR